MIISRIGRPIAMTLTGAALGACLFSLRKSDAPSLAHEPVLVRDHALVFPPTGGLRGMTTPQELREALRLVVPRWRVPKTNFLLHALRLWGSNAAFESDAINPMSNVPSGQKMLEVMTNSLEAERCNVGPYPFLYKSRFGVSVEAQGKGGGIAHPDQYLKVFGELGFRSATPIKLPDGSVHSLDEVIRDSLATFDIEQELEFTAIAYSHWLPPTRKWVNRYGVTCDFDTLASALLRRPPKSTSCYGVHTPYSLVSLIRANEIHRILNPATVRRLEARLKGISRLLEANQDESGLWLANWHESDSPSPAEPWGFQAILATGHHLEWIALAPASLRPGRDHTERAARALVRLMPAHTFATAANSYPAFSHACRALTLMEEIEPTSLLAPPAERPVTTEGRSRSSSPP